MTRLILGFAVTYLIISLPDIFGLTFAIQWVPGVSPVQKAWTYFTSGLAENALGKLVVATLSALLFSILLTAISRACLREALYGKEEIHMPNMLKERKAIIFDMDNTLLQSRINFPGMKTAVFQLLVKHQMIHPNLDYTRHSASQLIDLGRNSGRITEEIEASIWDTIVAYETEGMIGASLEEGAKDVLDALRHHYTLTILTNNARSAALQALQDTGIIPFFDLIAGREQMTELKPSPSGIHYILDKYPNIPAEEWIMVGDSWIDGKAAQDGGIGFIAYQSEPAEMESHGVTPLAYVQRLEELLY